MVGLVKQKIRHELRGDVSDREAVPLRHGEQAFVRRQFLPLARVALYDAPLRRGVEQSYLREVDKRLHVRALVPLPDETAEFIRHHRPVYRHEETFEVIFQNPAVAGVVLGFLAYGLVQMFHGGKRTLTLAAVETRRDELRLEKWLYPLRDPRLHYPVPEHRREHLPQRRPFHEERDRGLRPVPSGLYLVAQFQQPGLVVYLKGRSRLSPRLVAAALIIGGQKTVVAYGDMLFRLVVHFPLKFRHRPHVVSVVSVVVVDVAIVVDNPRAVIFCDWLVPCS